MLGSLAFLAACGIDGPPEPPAAKPKANVTIGGTVNVGIGRTGNSGS